MQERKYSAADLKTSELLNIFISGKFAACWN